jgi:hypothetical protein
MKARHTRRKTRSKRTHSRKTRSHKHKKGGAKVIQAKFYIDDKENDLQSMSGTELGIIEDGLKKFGLDLDFNSNNNNKNMYMTRLFNPPFFVRNPTEEFISNYVDKKGNNGKDRLHFVVENEYINENKKQQSEYIYVSFTTVDLNN